MQGGGASPVGLQSMSTEDLMRMKAAGSPQQPQTSAAMDVVKSIPGAIPRAAAALIGLPQTIWELGASGIAKGAVKMGARPEVEAFAKPELTNLGNLVTKGYDAISDLVTGKPLYTPQTGAGRIADLTAQTLVSGPGSMLQKGAMGVAGGSAGEATRLVTDNPIAVGVMTMLGAGAASLPQILRSVPAANINEAIKGLTPQHLAAAQQLMDDAAAQGVKLTGAEAIAQITGKNTLQDIQRVVEASKQGGPGMQQAMNQRPGQIRQMVEGALDQVGPAPAAPSATPVRMAKAGEEAITKARQAGNAAAQPAYDVARTQRLSSQDWNAVTQNPASLKALQAVKQDPIWGVTAAREGDIAWLDAAKRWIDDKLRTANPAEARIWQKANDELKMFGDAASPAYAQARGAVASNQKNVVDPMKASPVGDIAGTKGLPAEQAMKSQSEILMPTAPRALDPVTIRISVADLSKQDPTAARDFVRQNLQAIFDESAQNLASGANQWGGAKFAAQVAGNPRQKDNLQALVESVGNRQTWVGFNRMLDVLEATGKRHAPGSQTAFNQQLAGELSAGGLGAIPASIASPQKAMGLIGGWYDNFRFGKNTAEMAAILTDPKSVQLMQALAKEAPSSARASAIVAQILAAQSAATNSAPNSRSP